MIIIHGEDQIASRKFFLDYKAANPGDILEAEGMTASEFRSRMESVSLFGDMPYIYLEGLFSRRPSNDKKEIIAFLAENNPERIIIWEAKDVSVQLKDFNPGIVKNFPMPRYASVFWSNPTLENLHKALAVVDIEPLFYGLMTVAHRTKNKDWIKDFLEIEYKQKTSAVPYDLVAALEFWLLNIEH